MTGEQLSPYALSTLQRVKDLLFDPNLTISLTGAALTSSSNDVTGITVQTSKTIRVGQTISGTGIPAGTTIAAIISPTEIHLSQNATASNTGQTLTVIDQPAAFGTVLTRLINAVSQFIANECGRLSFVQQTYTNDTYSIDNPKQTFLLLRNTPVFSISSFQYRAGTPSNPNWTDFIPDQYELVDPRTDPVSGLVWYPSGEVRVYGVLPRLYSNMIRATYVGGYPVDWPNAGNGTTHQLPADLTYLCENLVVRRFKRRQLAGQSSQALEGATTSYRNDLDADDLDAGAVSPAQFITMDFQVQIQGLDQLTAKLAQAPAIAAPILQRALSASQAILAKYTVKGIVPWRTGFLAQTIQAELTTGMLRWFPTASYAPFVEFDTKPHVILPKDKKALFWPGAAHPVARVNHPGTKPNDFMGRIVAAAQPDINAMFGTALAQITAAIAAQ